jgi:alkaline phosphatase D
MDAAQASGEAARSPSIRRREFLKNSALFGGGVLLGSSQRPAAAATTGPKPQVASATIGNQLLVAVRTNAPARVRVRAWPLRTPCEVVETGWVLTNAANTAQVAVPGAALPGEEWAWQGWVQDRNGVYPEVPDVVRTLPARPAPGTPSSFRFAFGSCWKHTLANPAMRTALSMRPLFFAFIGDLGYLDDTTLFPNSQNYAGYLSMWRILFAHADFAPLLASIPIYAVQDDHDYGLDDCWGATIKSYAAQAFADFVPGGVWPGGNYRRWSIGQADFFLTDNRRYRDPPTGPYENGMWRSVLGSAQRNWLQAGLAASAARVKVVFLPMTMVFYWGSSERENLLNHIASNVTGTVIFCSGDKHAGAFARYSDRTWEMLGGPMSNDIKHFTPARTYVTWTENGTDRALYDAFGVVDVDTASVDPSVSLRLMRSDGVELHREVVPVT